MAFGPEGIAAWNDTLFKMDKNRAERPFIQQNAQAESDYTRGKADVATNQAGLLGEEMKYAPEKFRLHNNLIQSQIGAHNRANQGTASDRFASNPGKLFHDYQKVVDQFGADSEQANMFKSMSGMGETAPKVFGLDEEGSPIYDMGLGGNVGGGKGKGKGGGGGNYGIDGQGNIYVKPSSAASTRDFRTIAGAENIKSYLNDVKEKLPQFQGAAKRGSVWAKGQSNRFLGSDFEDPSKLAEAEGALISAAEGFINTFGLNATEQNVEKAQKIFEPRSGESRNGYEKRLERQLQELVKVESRAQQRQSAGVKIGNIYGNQGMAPQQMGGAQGTAPPIQPPNPQIQQQKMQQLQSRAQAAIRGGADPRAVEAQINQMMGAQ